MRRSIRMRPVRRIPDRARQVASRVRPISSESGVHVRSSSTLGGLPRALRRSQASNLWSAERMLRISSRARRLRTWPAITRASSSTSEASRPTSRLLITVTRDGASAMASQ
jgi:hypothetical protein